MMNIRLKYARGREAMFVSHLDVMRAFARSFRRARIPIAYSSGFNPHAIMVFGQPLSVGVTSDAEYMDFSTHTDICADDAVSLLNDRLPPGLRAIEARVVSGARNIMSAVSFARYRAVISSAAARAGGSNDAAAACPASQSQADAMAASIGAAHACDTRTAAAEELARAVSAYLCAPLVIVAKKTKSGTRDTDIRRLTLELSSSHMELDMLVAAGHDGNLKPSTLVDALSGYASEGVTFTVESVHRTALFTGGADSLKDPLCDSLSNPAGNSLSGALGGSHGRGPADSKGDRPADVPGIGPADAKGDRLTGVIER